MNNSLPLLLWDKFSSGHWCCKQIHIQAKNWNTKEVTRIITQYRTKTFNYKTGYTKCGGLGWSRCSLYKEGYTLVWTNHSQHIYNLFYLSAWQFLLSLRFVAAVGARSFVRNIFLQWALGMTRTISSQDLLLLHKTLLTIELSQRWTGHHYHGFRA